MGDSKSTLYLLLYRKDNKIFKCLSFETFNELVKNIKKGYSLEYPGNLVLTFRELEFLTSFLLTKFLTFHHSWVSS